MPMTWLDDQRQPYRPSNLSRTVKKGPCAALALHQRQKCLPFHVVDLCTVLLGSDSFTLIYGVLPLVGRILSRSSRQGHLRFAGSPRPSFSDIPIRL